MANSWNVAAWPEPPCQWLEESLVEAFSIGDWRYWPTTGRMIRRFPATAPFPDGSATTEPGRERLCACGKRGRRTDHRGLVSRPPRGNRAQQRPAEYQGPCILALVLEYENDKGCVEDIGALNRWPERTRLPIDQYLAKWRASCQEIKAPGRLPERIATLLGLEGAPQQ